MPTACAAAPRRVRSSVPSATESPRPTSPMTFSCGTRRPRTRAGRSASRGCRACARTWARRSPSRSFSTTNAREPAVLAVGDREDDVEVGDAGVGDPVLGPVDHPLVAVAAPRSCASRAGSEPASGSDRQKAGDHSPVAQRGRKRSLSSGRAEALDRQRARAPGSSGSARTRAEAFAISSTADLQHQRAGARCRRTPRRTAARARPARPAARGCPTGTRPSRRSRPRAGAIRSVAIWRIVSRKSLCSCGRS